MNTPLWVVSCYYNWNRYLRKRANIDLFRERLAAQKIPLLIVECALPGRPYELNGPDIIHVRSGSRLWQKERLINLAIQYLPDCCQYVVWMDSDLLYLSSEWAWRVQDALTVNDILQPFSRVVRLGRDNSPANADTRIDMGVIAAMERTGQSVLLCKGHPGFAWAARKSFLLACPLYEGAIIGGGDKLMLHAWCGIPDCQDSRSMTSESGLRHYITWADRICNRGSSLPRMTYTPGVIHHLWHGDQKNRRYKERYEILRYFDFDPVVDLQVNEYGCWEWAGNKSELEAAVARYFVERDEDNCAASADTAKI